ncbi:MULTISPECIES: 2-hydroxychromene-2-carboxylate isomerase [Agrobacterium]|jgi:2-hydroxychromene-2-carboxylate isomerase|uniref:2-hydroxychromene-2-carboxylate isomerase n=1 Tax=Agrobacterium tumefaciens TaxID=358 RepID=A0AAW8LYH4_AGRTU|nr:MULTISPECIES: DsbA family protein [Agrobacterium]MBB4409213.1 2-hydroxychromene-2-carboxylate isomerase [Agrobacterium radiobacter]MBB4454693.1 2-hydroxychromene-2-carboxylate isomerase [Agrobacterium radiobacter]MBP2535804.1 2-hydroxychromene-2-carboxylate isomerase [Agrobacterium tumefaciens]MBP2566025.1 2-hydroxychromene-2-carboxylate isomerase [Agrobacterium tumefaciens]MDP9789453.1 2-hydroxychromene-2-carboxylate isomerase [Agrobacterium tumefaciens]
MTKTIDYFFSIGSPWAFIGLEPFAVLAKEQGATIRPHVIPLIEENGGIYSRNRPEARRAYWIRDLKRWAALRGKVLNFDNRAALSDPAPAGLIVAAAIETGDDWLKLAAALQEAFWVRGEDIGNADVRGAIATAAGFDAAALDNHGQSDAVAALQKASFEAARTAGVFGVPTYRYQDELYWGQDSLPFLECHLRGEKLAA